MQEELGIENGWMENNCFQKKMIIMIMITRMIMIIITIGGSTSIISDSCC